MRFAEALARAPQSGNPGARRLRGEDDDDSSSTTDVKEGVDRETVEAVQAMAGKYKYGWETEIEMDYAPKGAERRTSCG